MNVYATAVEQYKTLVLEAERALFQTPATGFRETAATAYLSARFETLGYQLVYPENCTGFCTVLDTGKPGPEVLVLAELDALFCPSHEGADPETGAAHACGHHAQCAALLGLAAALKEPSVQEKLCGKVRFCAVPAEEFLEMQYRQKLRNDGLISCLSGKQEFLARGYFDTVDLAILVHTGHAFCAERGSIGFVSKRVVYQGVAAHAGGSPHLGKNALYAANCGLNAVNALRETFRERDLIRWHPILTSGGTAVNTIPETAVIESQLRGVSFDAIERENEKINRALCGAAVSFGTQIRIIDEPGYAPFENDKELLSVAKDALKIVRPNEPFEFYDGYAAGSTDMGDLACVMPVMTAYCGGASGHAHAPDYKIVDPELACVENAKWQLQMLAILLENGGEKAKQIAQNYQPIYPDKQAYLGALNRRRKDQTPVQYGENGRMEIKI